MNDREGAIKVWEDLLRINPSATAPNGQPEAIKSEAIKSMFRWLRRKLALQGAHFLFVHFHCLPLSVFMGARNAQHTDMYVHCAFVLVNADYPVLL